MRSYRPNGLQGLPVAIKNLLIINIIVFIAQNTIGQKFFNMDNMFALHTIQSPLFKPWQLVTHLFMHGDFWHIAFNMLALVMVGSILEGYWGSKRFLTFYFFSGIGAALAHMTVLFIENQQMINVFNHLQLNSSAAVEAFVSKYPPLYRVETLPEVVTSRLNEATIGASGAVFGCLAAFGYLFPNTYLNIYFFITLKAKWFVLLYAGYELFAALKNSAGDNVAHVAHLGGALAGFILVYFWNKRNRNNFY